MQTRFVHGELEFAPQHTAPDQFQFSLSTLLAVVTIASVAFSSFASCGAWGLFICIPAAIAAMAAAFDANTRTLRHICFVIAVCAGATFLLLAFESYPIIVIADSDLGVGAMARVGDWMNLCKACFAIAVVTALGNGMTTTRVRLALALPLLFWIATQQIESPDTPAAARMGVATLLGILIAADGFPALERLFHGRSPFIHCIWMLAVPGLVLLTDWKAQYYLFAEERERINRWDVAPSCMPLLAMLVLDVAVMAWISLYDHQKRN